MVEVKRLMSRNFDEIDKEKPLFQLLFLRNDDKQSVEVEEVEEIDMREVKEHLEQGESVFITLKRNEKFKKERVRRRSQLLRRTSIADSNQFVNEELRIILPKVELKQVLFREVKLNEMWIVRS